MAMHHCTIYTDHRVTRKKKVHTLYTHKSGQWSYHTELEDALERAIEQGSTRILFHGTAQAYLFQFIVRQKPKEPDKWPK